MSAWRREAEARIADLLGEPPASWIAWDRVRELPSGVASLVLTFVGTSPTAAERGRALACADDVLGAGGRLVVVDHNRPRRRLAALVALAGRPWIPGCSPTRRWRRLAHPTAREVQAAGFRVEQLRLTGDERVQLVIARKAE